MIIVGSFGMLTLAFFIIVFIVQYQKKILLHKAITQKNETDFQKQLLEASVDVAEQERRKIAANIHDDVGLTLNVIKLNFSKMKRNNDNKELVTELIDTNLKILEETSNTLRGISNELMPPSLSLLGLIKGLREMCRQISSTGSIQVEINSPDLNLKLDKKKELQLYRLIKEIINNIVKHANASQINLNNELTHEQLITIITHNGVGISDEDVRSLITSDKGIGLKSIQSRIQLTNSSIQYNYSKNEPAVIIIKTSIL